jgi:single-strand DNA-binding protein
VYLPISPSTGVPIEAANTHTTNAPKQRTKPVVLASKSFHLLQRLTTTPGLIGPVREVAADFFGWNPISFFGLNQIGHHGGVKNALALRHGANSSAALCGFLSPGKLWSLSAKDFAWHLGVHCAPCPFRQYVPIHSRPNSIRRNIMSSYKNNVRLEGNLGKNAEKKTTPNGDVVNFSIAVNEEWKDKDGNEHKNTDWFQIQVWGPLTKVAAHLKAGTPVIVEGKIKPETYTVDDVEHKTFSIKADYIRKINYTKLEEDGAGTAAKSTRKRK